MSNRHTNHKVVPKGKTACRACGAIVDDLQVHLTTRHPRLIEYWREKDNQCVTAS